MAIVDWLRPGRLAPSPPPPAVAAAAGRVALSGRRTRGAPAFGFGPPLAPFIFPDAPPFWDREAAMSLPTVSRCRDLICTAVAALPITLWSVDQSAVPAVEQMMPAASWMTRPDPNRTRQWLLAWTVDDLFFYELAHWLITSRFAAPNDWPATFERITPGNLQVAEDGTVTVTDDRGQARTVNPRDVVEFQSPIEGLLHNGYRAISIALQLDAAAERFAATEVPSGVLEEQESSEDLSADELAELAAAFTQARWDNVTAATNKHVKYRETTVDASQMQLVEGRTHQALELARLGNVPPYLVGAPAGTGMTYQNAAQARGDLIDFGALPFIGCIEQTLSGPNVTPRTQAVRLDANAWLRSPFTGDNPPEPSPNDLEIADPGNPNGAPA